MLPSERQADRFEEAGALLARAWLDATPLDGFPDRLRARTRAEAVAIQDAMAAAIGQPVTGWKLGATAPAMRARAGHDGAIIGRVFDSMTFCAPAVLDTNRFPGARVECEFAFHVHTAIPASKGGWDAAALAERVELHAALEIIGNRYPKGNDGFRPNTNDEIADNGAGIGFVFGAALPGWRDLDLSHFPIDIRVDGGPPAENFLGQDRCPPIDSLVQAAAMLGERGIDIDAGQYVSTGAATDPQPVSRGSRVVASFDGRATIEARFE